MNQSAAHLITLLCAVIAKLGKGVEASLPDGCTTLHYRVLAQLSLPESRSLRQNELARALLVRPVEIEGALASLLVDRRVRQISADGWFFACAKASSETLFESYAVTPEGLQRAAETSERIGLFLTEACSLFGESDLTLVRDYFYEMLVKPGSFFSCRATSLVEGEPIPIPYCVTAICMLAQTVGATAKCDADLSFTDFRLLLELYPKRRGVVKRLRAKDLVGYLRVGRSYVSTASARLEARGLIERIPDERDARGVLFALTPAGERVVHDVGDDVSVLVGGQLGRRGADLSQLLRILRIFMKGSDRALSMLREEAR